MSNGKNVVKPVTDKNSPVVEAVKANDIIANESPVVDSPVAPKAEAPVAPIADAPKAEAPVAPKAEGNKGAYKVTNICGTAIRFTGEDGKQYQLAADDFKVVSTLSASINGHKDKNRITIEAA